jgi:pimeloyl-ACP methyl ester carboxylesterase
LSGVKSCKQEGIVQKLIRDGIALAYEEAGSGLPPMLLVHCWCCDHGYMTPQFEHFVRGHRVISVDLRGHGESDKPRQEYTPAGFADDLAWLCGQLHVEKPVVVGHSMGGNVAFELARRCPDLPAAIIAVDSAIIPAQWVIDAVRQHMGTLRTSGYQGGQKAWVSGFFQPSDGDQLKAEILEGMSSLPPYVMISALDHHILSWDGAGAVAACKIPALLVAAATPLADLERMRQLCPQLVIGQTVGAGHFNNRVVPEQVNAMIERFLAVSAVKRGISS